MSTGNINNMPFKVNGDLKLISCSQRQMAALLGLSTTRINELVKEKVLVLDESRVDGRLMLCMSLMNYALSRKTTSEGVNFWTEKALHEKAKRELSELKLAQERGEVYKGAEVEAFLTEMLIDFRNKLSVLGHKLAAQLELTTAAVICTAIDAEIEQTLKELADEIGKGIRENPERGG